MADIELTPTDALNALHNFTEMFFIRNRLIADYIKSHRGESTAKEILDRYLEAEDLLVKAGKIALDAAGILDNAMKMLKEGGADNG